MNLERPRKKGKVCAGNSGAPGRSNLEPSVPDIKRMEHHSPWGFSRP